MLAVIFPKTKMHFLSGLRKRKEGLAFPNKFSPSKRKTFQSPAVKESANRLNRRFQSYQDEEPNCQEMRIKISKSVVDAMKIEAEELSYPMTLYTLMDQMMASETVMDMHANPSLEEHEEELGSIATGNLFHSFRRLSVDPQKRQKGLKRAFSELQSSVGSVTLKIYSWQEAKANLSSVLQMPSDTDDNKLVLRETTKSKRYERINLSRSGNRKKSIKADTRNFGLRRYLAFIKKSDKYNRSFASESKWKQITQMKVPEPIDSIRKLEENEDLVSESNAAGASAGKEEIIVSVTEKMDKLLRSRAEEAEREARAKERAEQERIEREMQEKEEEEKRKAEALKAASKLLRELTEEEHEMVHDALYGAGPESEKLAATDTDSVQRKSMRTLRPAQWVNDEVITFFYKMLAARDEALSSANPGRKRSHFFTSFFITKLFDEGCTNEYCYKNVKRWSKKVPGKDIFALDKILFAVNVGGSHWTCAVVYMEEKRIQYYDSLGGDGYGYTSGLMRYLKDEWASKKGGELPDADKWEIVGTVESVPHQQNGYDCGVFTCMFADFLSLDRPLSFNQMHINQCRERIALSILNGIAIE